MKDTVIKCDVCGKADAKAMWVIVDRRMDLAGSMEDISDDIDLCPDHTGKALTLAISMVPRDKRGEFISRVKAWKSKENR